MMKKVVLTVAVFSLFVSLQMISPRRAASRNQQQQSLPPTPAPVEAGGSIATAIGLVGSPTDYVFALRGGHTKDFWRYSIFQNTWVSLPNTPAPVGDGGGLVEVHTYNNCSSGANRFALAALRGDNTTDFWFFDINGNSWCAKPGTPAPVGEGGAIAQLQRIGKIYVLRGGGTADFWMFDSQDNQWTKLANTPGVINAGGGLVGINYGTRSQKDILYALQGGGSTEIWKYDVDTDAWTHHNDTPASIGHGGGITSPNYGQEGTLVVLQGGGSKTVWSLDIADNKWTNISDSTDPVLAGGAISNQVNGCSFALSGGGSTQFFTTGIRACVTIPPPPLPDPDFSLNFEQPTIVTSTGTKILARLNLIRQNGFTGKITLYLPTVKVPGIKVPEDLPQIEGDNLNFKIKVKGGAQPGSYLLNFIGADESGRNRIATLTLIVQ
jgi:hypothetical protein